MVNHAPPDPHYSGFKNSFALRRHHQLNFWPTLLGAAALLLAAALLFLFDPAQVHFYPVCLFHRLTGLYCPGCGSLRASHQLLHGRIGAAFGLNPLLIMALPSSALLLMWRARSKTPVWSGWFWLGGVIIIGFGVWRNLSFYPFASLAP